MARYSMAEAQQRLPELLAAARRGDEVAIVSEDGEVILQFAPKPATFKADASWFRERGLPLKPDKPMDITGAELIRQMRDQGY